MDAIKVYGRVKGIPCLYSMDIIHSMNSGEAVCLDGNKGVIVSIIPGSNNGGSLKQIYCVVMVLEGHVMSTNIPVAMGW